MAETKIITPDELSRYLSQMPLKSAAARCTLFGGDRFICIDEGVVIEEDGKLIAVATIAPCGEQNSGEPTIVGFYVMPEFRRQGYAKQLMQSTVERCVERGLTPVRVDALVREISSICKSLPEELQTQIVVHDFFNGGFPFFLME